MTFFDGHQKLEDAYATLRPAVGYATGKRDHDVGRPESREARFIHPAVRDAYRAGFAGEPRSNEVLIDLGLLSRTIRDSEATEWDGEGD